MRTRSARHHDVAIHKTAAEERNGGTGDQREHPFGPECSRLEREVEGMIAARETHVIFDMGGVTHADSAAIGAIVRCLTKLKDSGGGLRIAPQPMIEYSLRLTKVDQIIEMFPTVEQAMERFAN